ncbi:MAG: DUF4251 domain-containing protein [Pedobacter sp.]|jgi:hypothetical protein
MKVNRLGKGFILHFMFAMMALPVLAQNKAQKLEQFRQLMESKVFVFVAQSATPASGSMIQLDSNYYLKINKDSLESYLPYYGVAYQARFGSTDSPMQFESTDFDYTSTVTKNGNYDITIRMIDPKDPNQLNLSVSTSGYASLRVISMQRQAITFYGEVVPPKAPKKQ